MFILQLTADRFETREEAEDALDEWVAEHLDDLINEDYPEGVTFYGMNYSVANILRECDPCAYKMVGDDFFQYFLGQIEEYEDD